jgi:DNA-binding transcriptional LysR family regulator
MLELLDLKSFVEVVENSGFGRAARRLGMSKSMVSRRIARMEADLGTPLLNRTTRGVSPTEAGREFKIRSERILSELEEAREMVARQGVGVVGRLRLSAPLSFGVRHVTPVLAEMALRHPKLEIEVFYSDRLVDLIGERFDAAIRIGELKDSSLIARRIAPVRAVLVASPTYLKRKGRPATPGDLATHECLINTGGSVTDWVFRAGKRSISIHPQGRLRTDSGEALVRWAIDGLGIAFMPSFLVSDEIASGRLEPLLVDYIHFDAGIHVVRPPGPHVPAKVRVLIDTLVEKFGGDPVWDRCLMHAKQQKLTGRRDHAEPDTSNPSRTLR